jgi:hypothetical protein
MRASTLGAAGQGHQRAILEALPAAGTLLYCGCRDAARRLEESARAGDSVTALALEDIEFARTHTGGERFDVIVVDDPALRPGLLARLRPMLAADGVVFLAHAQHACYDADKRGYRDYGSIGPDPGSDSHLWYGGPARPRTGAGGLPVIVSYFTTDTAYAALADRLRASCDGLGLTHYIVPRPARGSWEANCATKAEVCLTAWRETQRPILWVDADAIVRNQPSLLAGSRADFAIHKYWGWEFASGTLFFGRTPLAERLLTSWVDRCAREPRVLDQVHLGRVWDEVAASAPLHTTWLPRAYCQIFDTPLEHDEAAVIEHFQASRSQKAAVTVGDSMPWPVSPEDFKQARRASRPLTPAAA